MDHKKALSCAFSEDDAAMFCCPGRQATFRKGIEPKFYNRDIFATWRRKAPPGEGAGL
jgi:hypothetical protein